MSRFGVQPARDEIARQGWTITRCAEALGVSRGHLNYSLLGTISPSRLLRESLPELLGIPLEKLFTEESLAATYGGGRYYITGPIIRPTKAQKQHDRERQAARS